MLLRSLGKTEEVPDTPLDFVLAYTIWTCTTNPLQAKQINRKNINIRTKYSGKAATLAAAAS